ncbi:DNA-directed RNA polymerase subunit alpha [Candidatus Xianfuyuplasma coldseepsis]|uniref:DNA-directed RNA polymerase subunit alpha n=1 Tax=Candidatus Xianfuyuplasma coldseepsis TaxID=2782163 RepID=A0A7L7KWB4_9MOLU|nr:DNA-directed RNA polymerase subunit alpha [Xianfuyuplasma coldseepsis]QMS86018.1 DNA-directed RNA polymerase subunit alpha [Xianfuyuplasma coldseepsis]
MKFEKPNTQIEVLNETNTYGKFIVSPLERGYGITLGNSLRRILLSSLPGCAIVNCEIDGVQHEFSSMDGVVEDVTGIVLNLKEVVLTIDSDDPNVEKRLEIYVEGPQVVTAKDIISDNDVNIINEDQHICTVNSGTFRMIMTARKGVGYVNADDNKEFITNRSNIGIIPIDSIYTPVNRVNYDVGPASSGNSGQDKLTLEIWTNGSVNPQEAIAIASKMMIEHLKVMVELSEKVKEEEFMIEREDEQNSQILEMQIEDLDLSVRSYNCLKRAGINTVEELTQKTEEDMMKVRNLGKKSLKEVKQKLDELGLGLARH